MDVALEVLTKLFTAVGSVFGKINWQPSNKHGRSFSSGSNIDGSPMAGATDIHGKQFGVPD